MGRRPAQAMVEFAIVAPLLFFLFFALIEGGRLGVSAAMVVNAAREAAHAGTFDSVDTDAPLRTAANRAVPMLGTLPASAFTISPKGTDNGGPGRAAGGTISVTVDYAFPVNPLFATLFGNSLSLRSTSTMSVE